MSSLDEQELGQRVDRALATITSGPTPAAAILARGRRIRRRRAARAGAVAAVAVLAVAVSAGITLHDRLGAPGPTDHRHPRPSQHLPTKMSGLPIPVAPNLRLLIATRQGAAWYSTATRQVEPIAGLPPAQQDLIREPYAFGRLDRGWWATSERVTANPADPVKSQAFFFIADGSLTATRIGTGYAVDVANLASRAGAVWLVTHPPSIAKPGGSARAQLVSTAGRLLGPRYTLPAGYLLSRGVGRYLLLTQSIYQNRFELWDPRTGRVARRFDNVIAAGPEQIAWSPGCRGCRVQVLNVPTGKTVTAPVHVGQPAALNATISDDGQLLAMQLPDGKLSVLDTSSGVLTVIPGTTLSDAAWQHFGWLDGGHRLIVIAGPYKQPGPAQVAYWQPGDAQLRIATIHNPGEITTLVRSQCFTR